MNQDQTAERKTVRPVLIISKRTISLYSLMLERLMVGLAGESIPVALVCPPDCDVDSIAYGAVEVIRHPAISLPLMTQQNRKMLIQNLAAFKPTVLHCFCESEGSLTRQLSRQLDLPYLLTVNSIQKKWRQLPVSSKRCVKIIAPAESITASIAKAHPRFANRLEQVNIGTFIEETTNCFSVAGRLPSAIATAHLGVEARLKNLLRAVKHITTEGYQFLLFIIGIGRVETALRKSIAELGLSQIVIIIPELKPWRSVLAAADIFIQPAPSDDFNLLLLEAMSLGIAVAACRGGVDDLIIEGKTAAVFDPNDELSVEKTLRGLFDRPEFARKLATGAQQYLKENHSVTAMVSSILRIYNQTQRGQNPD